MLSTFAVECLSYFAQNANVEKRLRKTKIFYISVYLARIGDPVRIAALAHRLQGFNLCFAVLFGRTIMSTLFPSIKKYKCNHLS